MPIQLKKHQKSNKEPLKKTFLEKTIIFFSNSAKVLLSILGIFAFLLSLYIFYPRVTVTIDPLLKPDNPFYFPFNVKNIGNIKIERFSCDFKGSYIELRTNEILSDITLYDIQYIPEVKAGGSNPINFETAFSIPADLIKSATVFVKYEYDIPIIRLHFTDSTKFKLFRNNYNHFIWKEFQ